MRRKAKAKSWAQVCLDPQSVEHLLRRLPIGEIDYHSATALAADIGRHHLEFMTQGTIQDPLPQALIVLINLTIAESAQLLQ